MSVPDKGIDENKELQEAKAQMREIVLAQTPEAKLQKAYARMTELEGHIMRLQRDRMVLLDVKTTEGLSASEWMMRTAEAEKRIGELKEDIRNVNAINGQLLQDNVNLEKQVADIRELLAAIDDSSMEDCWNQELKDAVKVMLGRTEGDLNGA